MGKIYQVTQKFLLLYWRGFSNEVKFPKEIAIPNFASKEVKNILPVSCDNMTVKSQDTCKSNDEKYID